MRLLRPVTELGDPDHGFGYLFGSIGSPAGYRPALHIDRADWDDPDYMFLALVGGDPPGGTCQDEPGEGVDWDASSSDPDRRVHHDRRQRAAGCGGGGFTRPPAHGA